MTPCSVMRLYGRLRWICCFRILRLQWWVRQEGSLKRRCLRGEGRFLWNVCTFSKTTRRHRSSQSQPYGAQAWCSVFFFYESTSVPNLSRTPVSFLPLRMRFPFSWLCSLTFLLYFLRNFVVHLFLYRLFSVRYPLLLALLCSDVVRNVVILGGELYSDLNFFSFFFFLGGRGELLHLPSYRCLPDSLFPCWIIIFTVWFSSLGRWHNWHTRRSLFFWRPKFT